MTNAKPISNSEVMYLAQPTGTVNGSKMPLNKSVVGGVKKNAGPDATRSHRQVPTLLCCRPLIPDTD